MGFLHAGTRVLHGSVRGGFLSFSVDRLLWVTCQRGDHHLEGEGVMKRKSMDDSTIGGELNA